METQHVWISPIWDWWKSYRVAKLACQLDISGKSKPQLRNYCHQIFLWPCLWDVFLISNWYGWPQTTEGNAIIISDHVRKVGKQTKKKPNSQHLSIVSASLPVSTFLPCVIALNTVNDAMWHGVVKCHNFFSFPSWFLSVLLSHQQKCKQGHLLPSFEKEWPP